MVTRRKLALLATAGIAAKVALAQAPPAPARAESDADFESARQQARNNFQAIARVKLPMTVEPVTTFKA
jgi:hypothetical protein